MKPLWLAGVLLFARPGPGVPTVERLDRSVTRTDQLLDEAARAEASWSRLQRAWVDEGCAAWRCPRATGAHLAARQGAAARATRRFVQSARAELARGRRMLDAETVAPLAGARRRDRQAKLQKRVLRSSEAYATRLAWHARYVGPWSRAHRAEVERRACEPLP